MSGLFDEFSGSLTADVLTFNLDAIPKPDTLFIRMTRGERRIADDLRKQFGDFRRVVIDVDGEQHEFSADSLIQMLEDYEDAQGMNNHMKLFGTPERAARTVFGIVYGEAQGCDDDCPLSEFCDAHVDEEPLDDGGESALLEWLRGDAE